MEPWATSAGLPTPRWLRWWAVLTVASTLVLLTLGATVTTMGVGMADRQAIRSPLYLVELVWEAGGLDALIRETNLGLVVEHSHRMIGWIVGIEAIVLAAGLAWWDRRRWMRWMGLAALVGVSLQGVLGILRIDLQTRFGPEFGTTFAMIHGATAQLVLALLVCIAVWTSAGWAHMAPLKRPETTACRRATLVLVGLLYVQILFGTLMRHKELPLGMRLHVLLAFGVVATAIWAGLIILRTSMAGLTGKHLVWILWGLLTVQLLLGMETLLSKFTVRWPATQERVEPLALLPDLIRSVHFLVGALIFATAVSLALRAHRYIAWPARQASNPLRQLEGVA
jgi:cytochrome c oxidase assembly protein subunit 15